MLESFFYILVGLDSLCQALIFL